MTGQVHEPLVALWGRQQELVHQWDAASDEEECLLDRNSPRGEELRQRMAELANQNSLAIAQIRTAPPQTIAGVIIQLRILTFAEEPETIAMIERDIAFLEGLGGVS